MTDQIADMAQAIPDESKTQFVPQSRSTYTIVSITAYLLGVPKRIFENDHEPPVMETYEKLKKNKNARIIRNLCMMRTAIEQNFRKINQQMHFEYKGLMSIREIPDGVITRLLEDGITILHERYTLVQYLTLINRLISERLNNCKELYPIWISWQYLRGIFIMPNGLTEEGTKAAAAVYYENRQYYPYQVYMNWPPSDQGNLLYNDKKFVTQLYSWNHDEFTDLSKVSDVSSFTKGSIYDFLEESRRAVMVVDCENSDPYKLCATLKSLSPDARGKIVKIILYDDVHTVSAWRILENYTDIFVERVLNERIKAGKSLVDIRLTAGACREFYENHVDSFVIVSSDSDYWGLISSMPDARFLVMIEHEKCGPDMKEALVRSGIFYCYIDDFYSGDTDIQTNALLREIHRYIDQAFELNVNEMMDAALQSARIVMSGPQREQFYKKYIRPMHLVIDPDGTVRIELRAK